MITVTSTCVMTLLETTPDPTKQARFGRGVRPAGVESADVSATIKPTAQVADSAALGDGTTVWELAQIREHARLGSSCVIGRGAYVDAGVVIGDNVKLQNYALVYEPATLADGVFVGPAAVLTNDVYPRSVDPEGQLKRAGDWQPVGVTVEEGASLGARSVCVAPVRVGRWALVAAGAVVVKDVPASGWSRTATDVGAARRPTPGTSRTTASCARPDPIRLRTSRGSPRADRRRIGGTPAPTRPLCD
jgi:acetyltransferase-like isoleucine patch superfamily enzyme